jgi:protein phosphatase
VVAVEIDLVGAHDTHHSLRSRGVGIAHGRSEECLRRRLPRSWSFRVHHFRGFDSRGEKANPTIDLPQPPLAVPIVGVVTAIAIAGSPRDHLRYGRAFSSEQKPVLIFEALEPARSDVVLDGRRGLVRLWFSRKGFRHVFTLSTPEGVRKVVCEQKHMGSRAVVVICRDADSARKRFGIMEGESGACYTRTGRRFFTDTLLESQFLERVRHAVETAGIWESLKTDWVCLDCELMPWSAKAQELLRQQYAPTGAAAKAALPAAITALRGAAGNSEIAALAERFQHREGAAHLYVEAYRRYCWPVQSLADLKLAPFHVLASESGVHTVNDHVWHMETLGRICVADPELLLATPFRVVDLTDKADQEKGIQWWEELTATGGEGMVVKPLEFVTKGRKGLAQPAVKVRGREYLRIIYGPEYTLPEHLERLKSRGLGTKRSLALREFALGLEALERFVHKEPLRRVHECVFGVLALESEPVDPRP